MAKKPRASVTSEWGNLISRVDYLADESRSKRVYHTEPVDLETFVTSEDYLNQGDWGMSDAQKEFIEAATDFENDKTFFVLMVG